MTRSLPTRPSLENLKKQAKSLLKSHQASDPSVCSVLRLLRRFSRLSDPEILESPITLAEAQYALAMDYGFASWNDLKETVEGREDERKFLHLHCGDSSAESLRRSGVAGTVEAWYDPFTEGAVPAGVTDEEWFELRASTPVILDRLGTVHDGICFLKDMYARMDRSRDYEEVVLWFDACLFDQTILMRHLDWFSRQDMGATRLSLICVGEFPGFVKFSGLGELRPEQMASLLDTRHEVTRAEMELATRAWDAYRSSDPTSILDLLSTDTSALPYLGPAFRRHLQRFPSVRNGLSRLEQACFELTSEGYHSFPDIFVGASALEDPPYFGDTMLLAMLEELTRRPNPLLTMEGREFTQGLRQYEWPVKKLSFHLSESGRGVLAGSLDRVRLRGIDRWLGGVHLQGDEDVWRWDEDAGRLVTE